MEPGYYRKQGKKNTETVLTKSTYTNQEKQ